MGSQYDESHVHHLYGASPAVDLLSLASALGLGRGELEHDDLEQPGTITDVTEPPPPSLQQLHDEPMHVLLVGCADPRHVIATMAGAHMHARRTVHFHVYEPEAEELARHMLLFLSFVDDTHMDVKERCALFLEAYWNFFLRDVGAAHVAAMGKELCEVVSGGGGSVRGASSLDVSSLKFQDKDELVEVFNSWKESVAVPMADYREGRLRHHYKERYDAMRNLIDWDHSMRLEPNASIIHVKRYRRWRVSGLAYEYRDSAYSHPNRSLVSYVRGRTKAFKDHNLVDHGLSIEKRGYWGDIKNSPYMTLGAHGGDTSPGHFVMKQKQHVHSECDCAEYNVYAMILGLEHGIAAHDGDEDDNVPANFPRAREDEQGEGETATRDGTGGEHGDGVIARTRVTLYTGDLAKMLGKSALRGRIDAVALGFRYAHLIGADEGLERVMKPDSMAIVEMTNFFVTLDKSQETTYKSKVIERAAGAGWEHVDIMAKAAADDDAEASAPGREARARMAKKHSAWSLNGHEAFLRTST